MTGQARGGRVLVITLASALTVSLGACGGGDAASNDTTTTTPVVTPSPVDSTVASPEPAAPIPKAPSPEATPLEVEIPEGPEMDTAQMVEFSENVSALCRGGGGVPGTAAYDPAAPGPHPVLVYAGNHDADYASYGWRPAPPPGNGILNYNQYAYAQLVACIDGREGLGLARVCDVQGSDGSIDETRSVEIYNAASYHVTVYAAATGEPVAETSLTQSEPEGCPLSVIFSGDQTVVTLYASPSEDSLRAFLEPLIVP